MRIFIVFFSGIVNYTLGQQTFQAISLATVAKVIPHAKISDIFDLTTKLNAKKDKVDEQKKIVNNFYNNGKFGKPKPNQRVLSWYDDKDYSKKKLISLVEQRVCVKKLWSKWMPVLKNRYGEATAQKHKDLFSFLDIQFLNSVERSLGMYWNAAYYKDYAKNGEDKAYQFYEQFAATLNQQFYETPQLAWILYDTNWEKNHNQTYSTGKW